MFVNKVMHHKKSHMKYFIYILFIISNFSIATAQEIPKEQILEHGINSITSINPDEKKSIIYFNSRGLKIKEGEIKDEVFQISKEYFYNEKGQLVQEKKFSPKGLISSGTEFYYSKDGKLTKSEFYYSFSDKEKTEPDVICTFEYNSESLLIKEVKKSETSGNSITTYLYDEDGKLILEKVTNDKIGKEKKSIYKYDKEGLLSQKKTTYFFSNTKMSETYSYDDNKQLISLKETSSNGLWSLTTYHYDEKGLLTSFSWQNSMDKDTYITKYFFK